MNTSVCFFVVNVYTTVVFEQSEDLKDVIILNILKKKKMVMSCLLGSFHLKIV